MVDAVCGSCGNHYQVTDPQKRYRCKNCGGVVQALARESKPKKKSGLDIEGTTCPRCMAFHPSLDVLNCDQCGQPLEDRFRASNRQATDVSRLEGDDRIAARKIQGALKYVFVVRIYYIVIAVLYGGRAMGSIFNAISTRNVDSSSFALLDALFYIIICAVTVFAALKVYLFPLVTSIVPASLVTVSLALWIAGVLESSPDHLRNIYFITVLVIQSLIMALCWSGVVAAVMIHRKLLRLPGMYISERGKLCRERKSDTRYARRLESQRESFNRKLKFYGLFAGIGAVTVILVVVIALQSGKPEEPPPLAGPAELFAEAWNASNGGDEAAIKIAFFFQKDSVQKMERLLRKRFIKYEWMDQVPRIGNPVIGDPIGEYCKVVYPMSLRDAQKTMITTWKYSNGGWNLSSIRYPDDI